MKKLIITLAIIISVLSFFVISRCSFKKETVPLFVDRDNAPSLVEILAEPGSSPYGSSIDVWFYKDSLERIEEIAVTGHADSKTCGLMSSLFFNTYLQKFEHSADFFVAGAGRLVGNFNDDVISELETRDKVKLYSDKYQKKGEIEFAIELYEIFPTFSETNQSPLEEYQLQLKAINDELELLENDPDVKEYKQILFTRASFLNFAEESNRHAENSGLVRIHQLPQEIISETEERIKTNVSGKKSRTINFSDLLEKYQLKDGIVWTETYRLDNGEPLVIRIPVDELSKESFEKAKEANRNEVEIAMVGDVKRRIKFFDDQTIEVAEQERHFRGLTEKELEDKVCLDKGISAEGVIVETEMECITKYEYLKERIPDLKKFLKGNIEDLQSTMSAIEKDKDLEKDSKAEALTHMTLIDAMLRDWNLPVGSSQKAFDTWRMEERENTWKKIERQLKNAKIPVEALESENIVFSVKIQESILEIKPMQVLDLANSIVVLNPELNIAKVESAWSQRKMIQVEEKAGEPTENSASLTVRDEVLKISTEGNTENAEKMLIGLLNIYPKETLHTLEKAFTQVSGPYDAFKAKLLEEVRPSIQTTDFLAAFDRFSLDPRYEDSLILYITNYRNLLLSFPNAPVDFHLGFAIRLGSDLADFHNNISGDDLSPWDVIERCETSSEAFNKDSELISEGFKIPFSMAEEIRKIMGLIKVREKKYYDLAKSAREFPKELSEEYQNLSEQTEEITLFQRDAQNFLTTLNKLKNHALGKNAALKLVINENPELQPVIEELENATSEGKTGKNLFFLSALNRLKDHRENGIQLDNLARIETYYSIQTGCEITLMELGYLDHQDRAVGGYDQLYSRFLYESGDFGLAVDNLFDSLTNVGAYHPQLSFKILKDDWNDYPFPDYVKASAEGDVVTIKANRDNNEKVILEIINLPPAEAVSLCEKINELPEYMWASEGSVAEKVLMAKVPVRVELLSLFKTISSPKVELAILKAMVYGAIPPGIELIEPSGEDKLNSDDRKRNDRLSIGQVKEVKVPSLAELEYLYKVN